MPVSDDRAAILKANAEARFVREAGAKAAVAKVEHQAIADREKTARLRAQRLAREEAERAETKLIPTASKPRKVAVRVRKGLSSA